MLDICRFFNNPGYKAYLENAMSFNRKLNEERKMRLPYIDSQTGIAQRSYNSERHKRERMPGMKIGQVYSYPQKRWRKKKYKYLDYFMQPPGAMMENFSTSSDISTEFGIKKVENSGNSTNSTTSNSLTNGVNSSGNSDLTNGNNSEEHTSIIPESNGGNASSKDWIYYDDDEAFLDDLEIGGRGGSDSDFDDDYGASKKKKGRGGKTGRGSRGGRKYA